MRHFDLHPRTALATLGAITLAGVGITSGCGTSLSDDCASLGTCPADEAGADAQTSDGSGDANGDGGNADVTSDGQPDSVTDAPSEANIPCDGGILCNGSCVNLGLPTHCGSCSNVCPAPTNGTATCSMPTCGIQCNSSFHACQGSCLPNSNEPSMDACVIDDSFGVFVSINGANGAAGTKAAPLAKIQDGIAKAKVTSKTRVYVCAGTYAENVVIDSTKDGVEIYGGFDCTGWAYSASNVVKVAPTSGYALKLDSLTTGTRIEDVELDGPNGANAGDSSIAVFANAAQAVTFKRVAIKAGNGLAGGVGGTFSNHPVSAAPGGKDSTSGGGGGQNACLDGATSSAGGDGGSLSGGGGTGSSVPVVGSNNSSLGGPASCTDGGPGANGASQSGGTGATTNGTLTATGWSNPTSSTPGSNGNPGEGGGGGGGKSIAGGGGGGAGGCGGGRGLGGANGGSSIAIASFGSSITLAMCTVVTASAGAGGNGGDGQAGQAGGAIGVGACNGGLGGVGAGGSGGGGGSGGLSVGILWKSNAPTVDGQVISNQTSVTGFTIGAAGQKGSKGAGGASAGNAGQAGTDGAAGSASAVMSAP